MTWFRAIIPAKNLAVTPTAQPASTVRPVCFVTFDAFIKAFRPTQMFHFIMAYQMGYAIKQFKVFGSIIQGVVVFMVNVFSGFKRSAKHLFHNEAVFVFPTPLPRDLYLPINQTTARMMFSSASKSFVWTYCVHVWLWASSVCVLSQHGFSLFLNGLLGSFVARLKTAVVDSVSHSKWMYQQT